MTVINNIVYFTKKIADGLNLRSRKFVGIDQHYNRYYKFHVDGKEKRAVEYFSLSKYGEPRQVPSLWNRWLSWRVDQPPTIEEVLLEEQRQKSIKLKAKELEEQDAKLRLQEQSNSNTDSKDLKLKH
ncbi:hypothetical protein CYY_004183 [Polysphondylium violaceum]|uniref:NADH dehydrogenase [ubiquinone] 1 alpha subcomplex subunit 12 n=1 Tax=Polysphondylium violaceum TaxID=133409 RepID=A0A8J4PVP0_9MYCE|nr:hypothetical protein CYY_004183 [Polysphondylium violaceum]